MSGMFGNAFLYLTFVGDKVHHLPKLTGGSGVRRWPDNKLTQPISLFAVIFTLFQIPSTQAPPAATRRSCFAGVSQDKPPRTVEGRPLPQTTPSLSLSAFSFVVFLAPNPAPDQTLTAASARLSATFPTRLLTCFTVRLVFHSTILRNASIGMPMCATAKGR